MAGKLATVQVQVNHVMRRHGAMETDVYEDQIRDQQRIDEFMVELYAAAEKVGFLVDDMTVIESHMPNRKTGHWPEIHIVLAQVPEHLRTSISERTLRSDIQTESSEHFQRMAHGQQGPVTGFSKGEETFWLDGRERGV